MARKRRPHEGKLRTREHVIADLAVNHVERHILLRGFAVSRIEKDYGLDLMMHTFSENGELENGDVFLQLKASDSPPFLKDGRHIGIRVAVGDLRRWRGEYMPVILIFYHGKKDKAFWLYVQQYLEENEVNLEKLPRKQARLTLRVPTTNRLTRKAIETFRQFRNRLLLQMKGTVKHGR